MKSLTYDQAVQAIHATQKFGTKLGLTGITHLMQLLDNPHQSLKVIHVAGTNGKGSTTAFIQRILQEHGQRAGMFTSPFLTNFCERISVNGRNIPEDILAQLAGTVLAKCREMAEYMQHPTEFEIITAIAFMYFKGRTDYVVLETGMGGKLDATNIVKPICSVITQIDYDHTEHLGNTLEEIAEQKAGIIKSGCPVVLYPQLDDSVLPVLKLRAEQLGSPVIIPPSSTVVSNSIECVIFDNGERRDLCSYMLGTHQAQNAAVAIAAIEALNIGVSEATIRKGLKNTCWAGRFEMISRIPLTIVDGAHNPSGIESFVKAVEQYLAGERLVFVMGMLNDKQYAQCVQLVAPLCERFIACEPPSPRAVSAGDLGKIAAQFTEVEVIPNPYEAFKRAQQFKDVAICVFGSLYLVGQVLNMKYACIQTFGCLQNQNDSEKISGMLAEMGYMLTSDESRADIIVYNTCAIRENAENKVVGKLGYLKELKRKKPELIIAVCGCMAGQQHIRDYVKKTAKHVDLLFNPGSLHLFPKLLNTLKANAGDKRNLVYSHETNEIHEGIPINRKGGGRALVSIMYGCDNFCSYCVVPYVRGREKSRAFSDIIEEATNAVKAGMVEIMLLGQNVYAYTDGANRLPELLREINKIDGIRRIRFMTGHPKDMTDDIITAIAESDNVCKAVHLPVQAGSDKVLKHMNRKYTSGQYLALVQKIRERIPDVALTSDVIVGYPTETLDDFEQTLKLLKQVEFNMIFSFIFSPRKGTAAYNLPMSMDKTDIMHNFTQMLEVQAEISLKKNQQYVGKKAEVLIETETTGRTERGTPVMLEAKRALIGKIVMCEIQEALSHVLKGTIERPYALKY